ncbi:MAG TPA: hypothetical protein VEU28_11020 [Actinomycetota bacterium]|nr:hypothetical protein [Actinomycetota bacterium]
MGTDVKRGFSSEQLKRLGGAALMAAFPLQVAGFLMHPPSEQLEHVLRPTYGAAHMVIFASWLLALLGLPALYAGISERAGKLGLLGFVWSMVAVAYHCYLLVYEAFAVPAIAKTSGAGELLGPDGPLAHGAGALGILANLSLLAFPVFGIAILRSGAVSKGPGWLQIAAVPGFMVGMVLVGVLGGPLGPEAETWVSGMLPVTLLYALLFAGYAWAGVQMRAERAPEHRAVAPSTAVRV